MRFEIVSQPKQLAALQQEWNDLAGDAPLRSPAWLTTWWNHYGDNDRELFVVIARHANGDLLGIAPWYIDQQGHRRTVRWLGDGPVCTDHTTLLCEPSQSYRFVIQLTDWLLSAGQKQWTEFQLESIDTDDPIGQLLIEELIAAGCLHVEQEEAGSCYINLPNTFDDYLMAISKNHRKRCRRWDKAFYQTGRAQFNLATTPDDCLTNWHTLVGLHNARRASLGESGAFEDTQFAAFHQQVIPRLASRGNVQLRVLKVDGQPVAAEYVLQDHETWHAYQSGMSEAGEEISAGSLSILALVRDAIAAGCTQLDLMRGDEPYKFSWGAEHRPASTITLRQPSATARLMTLKDSALVTARRMKRSLLS